MKEFVEKLREKADTFEKSGCAVEGIVKDYRKSADMIEKLCGNIGGFVEKLIERLEEEKEENPCRNMKCRECQYTRNCYKGEKGSEVAIDNAIKIINQLAEEYNQDSTKKNQGWIPCSERLPKERDWYLAMFQEVESGFIGLPFIADYLMGVHTKYTTDDGWIIANCTDTEDGSAEYYKKLKCIAWQPLPEPYKPEQKEEPQTNFYSERFNKVM